MPHSTDHRPAAIAAAHAASSAVTELLRYAREGNQCNRAFDHFEDPIAQLADALAIAIEIEDPFLEDQPCYADEREVSNQLLAAIRRWQVGAGATETKAEPRCRVCGCTEFNACMTEDGPCAWAEPDLCTGCAGR